MRHLFLLALLICLLTASLGCNTMKGAGRDIQRGGEAVEDAAESAQK